MWTILFDFKSALNDGLSSSTPNLRVLLSVLCKCTYGVCAFGFLRLNNSGISYEILSIFTVISIMVLGFAPIGLVGRVS